MLVGPPRLRRGLRLEGDGDRDLDHFPTQAFDYAILSKTLQQMREPKHVLSELLRIAGQAVVSVPNFGHWKVRWALLSRGRMPETGALPEPWYSTPNIHLCTIRDFVALCDQIGVHIERSLTLDRHGRPFALNPRGGLANLLAEQAVFVLSGTKS